MTPSQEKLRALHGTPAEFAVAVKRAADDLYCTDSEAEAAIRKYEREWSAASRPLLAPISNPSRFSHLFQCPGCESAHGINLDPALGEPLWTLSGTPEAPTVRASLLVRSEKNGSPTVCHLYITDGRIEYLSDSTHALAGKTVDMEHL